MNDYATECKDMHMAYSSSRKSGKLGEQNIKNFLML
jgi:hypothetical protein